MNKKYDKRFPLPEGAKRINPPLVAEIATHQKYSYDAEVTLNSIKWLRVVNGFGGFGDREDWVADLAYMKINVSSLTWRKPVLLETLKADSFEHAIQKAMERALKDASEEGEDLCRSAKNINEDLKLLKASLKRRGTDAE